MIYVFFNTLIPKYLPSAMFLQENVNLSLLPKPFSDVQGGDARRVQLDGDLPNGLHRGGALRAVAGSHCKSTTFGRGCVNASCTLISSAVLQRERAPEPVDARRQRGGQQDEGGRLVRLQLRRQERPARLRQGAAKIHSGLIAHRFYRMIIMVLTRLSGLDL